jgi:hypothetical protein
VEKIGIQQARWRQLEFSKQWVGQLESSKQCEGHSECFSFTLKATMHKWNSASEMEAKLSILLHHEL